MPLLAACQLPRRSGGMAQRRVRVQAPFDMPAIAAAIAAANANGGGVVVVPPGTWPTGPVHLKSNVNLHLEKGATLLFSAQPQDYLPPVTSTWEGLECLNYSPAEAKFVRQIKGQAELPVRDVRLRDLRVRRLRGAPVITENVEAFVYDADKKERA